MKANEIYQQKANELYALLGPAFIQKKQLEDQIEDLELKLKGLVANHPLFLKIEEDLNGEE